MYLCLQNLWLHFTNIQNLLDLIFIEIRKSNSLDLSFLVGLFHLAITSNVVSRWLMDQKEIDVIGIQTFESFIDGIVLFIEAWPYFRLKENILTRHSRVFHSAAHSFFIHVSIGCVNEPIAIFERCKHRRLRFVRAEQESPNPSHRHLDPIVQSYIFHDYFILSTDVCLISVPPNTCDISTPSSASSMAITSSCESMTSAAPAFSLKRSG